MNELQLELLKKIRNLLNEAFEHSDGGKSSDCAIQVHYPPYHHEKYKECLHEGRAYGISIYSYALGPIRMHDFIEGETIDFLPGNKFCEDAFKEALEEVVKWHYNIMVDNKD